MSVLIPENIVFEYVENGFSYAANNTIIDDRYSETIRQHCKDKDFYIEAKRWTKNILLLVYKSYAARYNEELGPIEFYKTKIHFVNGLQLLKYLECLCYQIEIYTIEHGYNEADPSFKKFVLSDQDKTDYKILCDFIADLRICIISQLTDYKNAKWSD